MKPFLFCVFLLFTVPAVASEETSSPPTPPAVEVDQEFIRRISVQYPRRLTGCSRRYTRRELCPPGIPSWALSRMVILVPDGTPQRVYRAPSADWCSPDF